MTKVFMPEPPRVFFFSTGGDDAKDGKSALFPKLTPQAAIDEAVALVPPPGPGNAARVQSPNGGAYFDGFVLSDWIQFDGSLGTFNVDEAVGADLGSFLGCRTSTMINAADSGVCARINAVESIGLFILFMGASGINGIGVEITGICDDLFINVSQIGLFGIGTTGIRITGTSPTPIVLNLNTINLDADNTTFVDFNPANATDIGALSVSVVQDSGATGTTAYRVTGGTLIVEQNGFLKADTIVHVLTGATMYLDCDLCEGAVIVDSGGTLFARVDNHTGTLTNNGTINGHIGAEFFGDHNFDSSVSIGANLGITGVLGVGIPTPVPSAALEVVSASKGFLGPRMTAPERDNIASPAAGLEIYNITTNEKEYFDGTQWLAFSHIESIHDDFDTIVRAGQIGHLVNVAQSGNFIPPTQPASPVLSIAIAWNGSKLFMGNNAGTIRGFDLSTPWDITSASDVVDSYAPGFSVTGAVFSPDGLVLFTNQATTIQQANLTIPWDLNTAVSVGSETPTTSGTILDMSISPDGHNLYLFVTGGTIHQYFLPEPFQLSSIGATEAGQGSVGTVGPSFCGDFSNDGRILIVYRTGVNINEFPLEISWDITSIGAQVRSFNVGNDDTRGIVVKPDGIRFYTATIPDGANNEDANQFDLGLLATSISTGSVGVGASSIAASAVLEMASTSQGFLSPRMTTTERDAISSPATGLEIYNTTTSDKEFFDGSLWVGTTGGSFGPAGATDNAIVRFDGISGQLGQNSGVIIDDLNNITGVNALTISDDLIVDIDLIFTDKSNGTVTVGNAVTGTDRFNVFGGGFANLHTGIASFYNSAGALRIRLRDQHTLDTTPPTIEGNSSLGLAFDTTTAAGNFVWFINGDANEKMRLFSSGDLQVSGFFLAPFQGGIQFGDVDTAILHNAFDDLEFDVKTGGSFVFRINNLPSIDISASGMNFQGGSLALGTGNVHFGTSGTSIQQNGSNDLEIDVLAGNALIFRADDIEEYQFNSVQASWNSNNLFDMGILGFADISTTIQSNVGNLELDVATDRAVDLRVNNVVEYSFDSINADWKDNNIVNIHEIVFTSSGVASPVTATKIERDLVGIFLNQEALKSLKLGISYSGVDAYTFNETELNLVDHQLTDVLRITSDSGQSRSEVGFIRMGTGIAQGVGFRDNANLLNAVMFFNSSDQFEFNIGVSKELTLSTAVLDVVTKKIVNVVDPTDPQDAATKNFVDEQTLDISAKITNSAGQLIADATDTIIAWDSESYDTDGMHDLITDNSRITIQTAGKYLLVAQMSWANVVAINTREGWFLLNGVTEIGRVIYSAEDSLAPHTLFFLGDFAVNDYIELSVLQTTGGPLNFRGNVAPLMNYFAAHKF